MNVSEVRQGKWPSCSYCGLSPWGFLPGWASYNPENDPNRQCGLYYTVPKCKPSNTCETKVVISSNARGRAGCLGPRDKTVFQKQATKYFFKGKMATQIFALLFGLESLNLFPYIAFLPLCPTYTLSYALRNQTFSPLGSLCWLPQAGLITPSTMFPSAPWISPKQGEGETVVLTCLSPPWDQDCPLRPRTQDRVWPTVIMNICWGCIWSLARQWGNQPSTLQSFPWNLRRH